MKRILKRTLAFVGALAMVVPLAELPINPILTNGDIVKASAASNGGEEQKTTEKIATVSKINENFPISIDSAGGDITATVTFNKEAKFNWSPQDASIYRWNEAYWYGMNIIIPKNKVTDLDKVMFRSNSNETWRAFKDSMDSETTVDGVGCYRLEVWGTTNYEFIQQGKKLGKDLEYWWEFDWDGADNTGKEAADEKIRMVIEPSNNITLVTPNEQTAHKHEVYGYTYTTDSDGKYTIPVFTRGMFIDNDGSIACRVCGEKICDVDVTNVTNCTVAAEFVDAKDKDGNVITSSNSSDVNYDYVMTLKANENCDLPTSVTVKTIAIDAADSTEPVVLSDDNYTYTDGKITIERAKLETLKGKKIIVEAEGKAAVTFGTHSISINDNIKMNFYTILSDALKNDSTAKVKFTHTKKDGSEPVESSVAGEQMTSGSQEGKYKYSFDVAAKEMGDEVTAQMVVTKNGTETTVGDAHTYSVKDYVEATLADKTATELEKAAVRAALNYGAYAQMNFGYDTENLATKDTGINLASEMETVTVENKASATGELEGINYIGTSVLLKSNTVMRHYFTLEEGKKISDFTFSGNGFSDVKPIEQNDSVRYYVEIPVNAKNLGDQYTLTVQPASSDSETITITHSVNDYIAKTLADEKAKENEKNTVKALYLYGQAAKAYFDNIKSNNN